MTDQEHVAGFPASGYAVVVVALETARNTEHVRSDFPRQSRHHQSREAAPDTGRPGVEKGLPTAVAELADS